MASTPKTMQEFDYFDENSEFFEEEPDFEAQQAQFRRRQSARRTRLLASAAVLFFAISFAWAQRSEIAYAFSSEDTLIRLGSVEEHVPADIPENAYVEVSGLAEPRGLKNKLRRALAFKDAEYWLFRLVGSGGVYLETPADEERFGRGGQDGIIELSRWTVRGRAVDPTKTRVHRFIVSEYGRRFTASPHRRTMRMVQVDYTPGQYKWRYIGLFVFIAVLIAHKFSFLRKQF